MSDSEFDDLEPAAGQSSAAGSSENPDADISADLAFDLLGHDRRRSVLVQLFEREEATLRGLSEHIAAWETDTTVGAVPTERRRRVYTGLYHVHVPKLADAGVIEYDPEQDSVSITQLATSLVPYLEICAGD